MSLFLGIDIGTSATKALVIDDEGDVRASASSPHTIQQPHPGWSQQDPQMWWDAAVTTVRAVLLDVPAAEIAGVGLSGQMHGLVLLPHNAIDPALTTFAGATPPPPLHPALLWNDQRTTAECDDIERALGPGGPLQTEPEIHSHTHSTTPTGRDASVRLLGNAPLTGFTLPKLLWLRKHHPTIYQHTAGICLPKDFIALRLTGRHVTDVGDASGTLLFEPARRIWSDRACQRLGIDPALLPRVHESSEVIGSISPWAARCTGLREGTPVVIGSGDNMTSAIGAGVADTGLVAASLGTSGVIIAHADTPAVDLAAPRSGRTHLMCSAAGPRAWCITGCMLSAAGSLKWFRDTFAPGVTYDDLMTQAASVPPGAGGLLFLPYLTGERCPYPDPLARGAFVGLTSRHTRAYMTRALIEGVSFSLAQILTIVRSLGVNATQVRVGGGGAKSTLWRQILADVFNCPVSTTNTEEGPAYGAAILASVGIGHHTSVPAACAAIVRNTHTTSPRADAADDYAPSRAIFDSLYHILQPVNIELDSIERRTPCI